MKEPREERKLKLVRRKFELETKNANDINSAAKIRGTKHSSLAHKTL